MIVRGLENTVLNMSMLICAVYLSKAMATREKAVCSLKDPLKTACSLQNTLPYGQHSVKVGYTPHIVTSIPVITWPSDREFSRYKVVLGISLQMVGIGY